MSEAIGLLRPRFGVRARPEATTVAGARGRERDDLDAAFGSLFHRIGAMNNEHRPYLIQFASALPGEGTSTIATSFAVFAARDTRAPVLLLDCGRSGDARSAVPSLIDAFAAGAIGSAFERPRSEPALRLARLSDAPHGGLGLDAAAVTRLCATLREQFALVVLDGPPLDRSPRAAGLARHCDGTVLVVRAETTRRAAVRRAAQDVERFGGQAVGVVLNRARDRVPGWARRLLR